MAGDSARSTSDLNLPMVFVTLLIGIGNVRQLLDENGSKCCEVSPQKPSEWIGPLPAMIAVQIEGRDLWIHPWLYHLQCPLGDSVPLVFLDIDLEQNQST